jgi:hypothetical protein
LTLGRQQGLLASGHLREEKSMDTAAQSTLRGALLWVLIIKKNKTGEDVISKTKFNVVGPGIYRTRHRVVF